MKKRNSILYLIALFYFSNSTLVYTQATWQYFYSGETVKSIAARGNDILVCSDDEYGFVRFDTLGNATFYDVINGDIPFNYARQVAIDHTGNWWVAHGGGVARYDGANWTNWDTTQLGLSFYTSVATALRSSSDGRIAAATSSRGCAIFENNTWTTLTTANSGLPSNNIRDIAFGNDGKIYFATVSGLAVLDGANWTVYNTTNTGISGFSDCKSVALTSTGTIWVASGLFRFAKWEAGVWTQYTASSIGLTGGSFAGEVIIDGQDRPWLTFAKSISVLNDTVWTHYKEGEIGCTLSTQKIKLALDGAGRLWSTACGLTRFDGQTWDQFAFGTAPLPGVLYAATQDAAGNMWFAGSGGIEKKVGNTWQTFDPVALGAGDAVVLTAHGDAAGNVWFGVETGEILRFDGNDWAVFDTTAITFPTFAAFWSIASAPDGTVWFSFVPPAAFSSRLARYKNGEWTFFTPDNAPLATNYDIVSIVVENNNTTWFLANDRLLKYDGANWTSYDPVNSGLPFNILRHMAIAPDGALWITTNIGLIRFDGTNWTTMTTANSDIPGDDTYRIAFDQTGGMYIGYEPATAGANCAVLRAGEWTELLPPGFEPGFHSRQWPFITDRENRLWYANWNDYFNGIFVYDPQLVNTNNVFSPGKLLHVFPNPVSDALHVHTPDWTNQQVQIRIRNTKGSLVLEQTKSMEHNYVALQLPANWPDGVYFLEIINERGERETGRFVRVVER